ncbi:antitoxin [bacterium]|nr:antitoxin [bacterium]
MQKTQIQLPDELYRKVKAFAAQREWSLAETFRRAVEQLFERYPQAPASPGDWDVPRIRRAGWKGLSAHELHEAALEDMSPRP